MKKIKLSIWVLKCGAKFTTKSWWKFDKVRNIQALNFDVDAQSTPYHFENTLWTLKTLYGWNLKAMKRNARTWHLSLCLIWFLLHLWWCYRMNTMRKMNGKFCREVSTTFFFQVWLVRKKWLFTKKLYSLS
jgi:hypothetical protein